MAYSFENVKREIYAMIQKVPEHYLSNGDALIFLESDYLFIEYGRNEALKAVEKGGATSALFIRRLSMQRVYSEKSTFLVEMTEPFFEQKAISKFSQVHSMSTPLKDFVHDLGAELYHEFYRLYG